MLQQPAAIGDEARRIGLQMLVEGGQRWNPDAGNGMSHRLTLTRRLREQYPEVSIRVLYQRDYLHLLVKYGLEMPSQLVEAGDRDRAIGRHAVGHK